MGGLCGAWLCGERHRPSPHGPRCEIGATGPHSRKAKFLATAPFLQKRVVRFSRRTKTKKGLGFLVIVRSFFFPTTSSSSGSSTTSY